MQLDLPFQRPGSPADHEVMRLGSRTLAVRFVRHRRARRYILKVDEDGAARVTIPRGGNLTEARQMVCRHRLWIERQRYARLKVTHGEDRWADGTDVLFRGELVRLSSDHDVVRFGDQEVPSPDEGGDLKPLVVRHLRGLAERELPDRLGELAEQHAVKVARVSVRNQRTRWGSCSTRGHISLNWRLVQMLPAVRDYVIVHELMHVREPNHSKRFWRLVEQACPDHRQARVWLKQHRTLLV